MFFRIIVIYSLWYGTLVTSSGNPFDPESNHKCLTGYMTEVQSWVDERGVLIVITDYKNVVDLSANPNPMTILSQKMATSRSDAIVKYLSLARCRLTKVPMDFHILDSYGRDLVETVEYLTFYGNTFMDYSSPGEQYDVWLNATDMREVVGVGQNGFQRQEAEAVWSVGLKATHFSVLKELDLRACSIQVLSANIFTGMPNLEALYIGENNIMFIDDNAFLGLHNLAHLDFSRNEAFDDFGNPTTVDLHSFEAFERLPKLASLDMSMTKLAQRQGHFKTLGKNLVRLSVCESGITSLSEFAFSNTSLKILDVSKNNGIFANSLVLKGLENKLNVLYAKDIGLKTLDIFTGFEKLEILDASFNEITDLRPEVAESLKNLQVLNLDKNRIRSWDTDVFSLMPELKLLQLKENIINLITDEMINDLSNLTYVALCTNLVVCNCYAKEFIIVAIKNEVNATNAPIIGKMKKSRGYPNAPVLEYHRGFIDVNRHIINRNPAETNNTAEILEEETDYDGKFVVLDFLPMHYACLNLPDNNQIPFSHVPSCRKSTRDIPYDQIIKDSQNLLYTLLMIPIVLIIMVTGFIFRRNFRYFFIQMRNTAMLSMISKNEVIDDDAIFHYDVFVSYCNEDRGWVLDHLLPKLESDCSISACLHERDFQVGHSILENIVSCMDRSRSIMLIISQKFLLSKWCQFEMHLAQHRLLETRREDLTLVLLEDIPRRMRPNTLHYLMLTKTYIVWSKETAERELFWKRLKKSLVTIKMRQTLEGVSLA